MAPISSICFAPSRLFGRLARIDDPRAGLKKIRIGHPPEQPRPPLANQDRDATGSINDKHDRGRAVLDDFAPVATARAIAIRGLDRDNVERVPARVDALGLHNAWSGTVRRRQPGPEVCRLLGGFRLPPRRRSCGSY